jgi:3-mercaptopyruvate sulfurtransferase SseA
MIIGQKWPNHQERKRCPRTEEGSMKKYQDNDWQGSGFLYRCLMPMLLLLTALVAGCGGSTDTTNGTGSTTAVSIKLNTPANITDVSADNYDSNIHGLITGATLKRWKDDWINQRPAGITGKLVILQVTTGEPGYEYIAPPAGSLNVVSYYAAGSEWVMTRSNGVISTPSLILDGPSIDAELNKYGIDPVNDMIVVAQGTASTGNVMNQGRAWLALHYWGVDAKHLAVLNGGNKWQFDSGAMIASDFSATAATPPSLPAGTYSVKNLPNDNTSLVATVGDMLAVVPATDTSMKGTGVFLWDARTITQYSAGQMRELNDGATVCPAGVTYCAATSSYNYMSSFQNHGSRQGHPNGATDLNFVDLLDSTQGYSYKPKAELVSYLNGVPDASGFGMVDGSYNLVGAGNAYQPGDTVITYCETSYRAMITGMASGVILGLPTRIYDGAMIEWNSLSNLQDATGNDILPANSPWRTDVKSFFSAASSVAEVATRQITNAYAPNSNVLIAEDRAYKTPSASNTGSAGSAGGAAPVNPCGG